MDVCLIIAILLEMWFQDKIRQVSGEIERMAPNMKAIERLEKVEDQFKNSSDSFENARKEAKSARDQFKRVKDQRFLTFMKAFKVISSRIDSVYKELTKSRHIPVGGTAYLSLENNEVSKCICRVFNNNLNTIF